MNPIKLTKGNLPKTNGDYLIRPPNSRIPLFISVVYSDKESLMVVDRRDSCSLFSLSLENYKDYYWSEELRFISE